MKSYLIRFSFLLVCSIIILQHSSFNAFNISAKEIEELNLLEDEADIEFESVFSLVSELDDETRTFDWVVTNPINNYGVNINIGIMLIFQKYIKVKKET